MVKGVSTVWLPVDDLQRSLQFYGDTLGLTKKDQDGDDWPSSSSTV
jgi:catechol 2,3-dioxygenase-like lactoylglutathione lyase family enzyme